MGKAKRAAVAGDGRTERLEVRVSAAELAAMRAAAERDGAPLAVWARRALRVAAGLVAALDAHAATPVERANVRRVIDE